MSSSLRDQLLKAGLVTQKQAKQAEQKARQPQAQRPKSERGQPGEREAAAQRARAEKAARDQELNRRKQEKAERAARSAQVRQLLEQNRLPPVETEERYNFVDGGKIRSVAATLAMREKLGNGELAIVRCEGRYEVVAAATAARVRERDPAAVVQHLKDQERQEPADDPYKDHVVPDDLIW